jgi:hypothetical protein
MSYESENYLCDISCVQLQKTLARFRCGNTQLEVVLGVQKGVPYWRTPKFLIRPKEGLSYSNNGIVKNPGHIPSSQH